jgi:hypothetical protein
MKTLWAILSLIGFFTTLMTIKRPTPVTAVGFRTDIGCDLSKDPDRDNYI